MQEVSIDYGVYHSGWNLTDRGKLIEKFNHSPSECMVLINSFSVNSAGLNLQNQCRNVHLFSPTTSKASRIVLVYEYIVEDPVYPTSPSNDAPSAAVDPPKLIVLNNSVERIPDAATVNNSDNKKPTLPKKTLQKQIISKGTDNYLRVTQGITRPVDEYSKLQTMLDLPRRATASTLITPAQTPNVDETEDKGPCGNTDLTRWVIRDKELICLGPGEELRANDIQDLEVVFDRVIKAIEGEQEDAEDVA
ncbi:hypothetical protein AARAC_000260 [Aspergillus arachidicola]|uniref:Uncharacterized protein n=1 Tax=Aspergillus arachidicola TaxID=656916 RepID=A0A2G7FP42_9EURO|nr:hypothetical protein AARAC_000260 [Aspergillus arachidicola]